MSYSTLLVHMQLGQPNGPMLVVAADVAERFGAGVIGVAACQPMLNLYSDGYIGQDVFEQDRKEKAREIAMAEAAFRTAFRDRSNVLEWRSTITLGPSCVWIADQARCADLIVTGVAPADLDPSRRMDVGELLMQAGRPVLVVPDGAKVPSLQHAMVAWKNTRETRRAVVDALPLLRRVATVSVVEAASEEDMADARQHVRDVVDWLGRHDIAARGEVVHRNGDDAEQLDGIARARLADLVVAGAYGHSRLRESVLGGVTRSLLLHSHHCSLLSH